MEPEHTRVDRENRELEDVIATRDEAVVARARYHVDMAAAEATAKRFHLDSYLPRPSNAASGRTRSPIGGLRDARSASGRRAPTTVSGPQADSSRLRDCE
jgi:hypothetical protein